MIVDLHETGFWFLGMKTKSFKKTGSHFKNVPYDLFKRSIYQYFYKNPFTKG